MKRREIYFKELEITLETPLVELFNRYESLLFEIDRLSPKLIEYFDRPLIIQEILDYLLKPAPDLTDYQRTYKLPYYSQQLLVDRAGFFVDIFMGVSLASKYEKELALKFKTNSPGKSVPEDDDSSSSNSSSSSDDDADPSVQLQRKRSKTDSLTGQMPLIIEDNTINSTNATEKPENEKKKETCNVNEEEKKENIAAPVEQEYSPKRSKTSFKRGGESPKKEAAGNGLIEGITVIKTMDYKYMEILCKVLEGGVNDVGQGYCQKIISAFLAKKPMEVEQFFYERKKIRMLILKQANTKVIAALIVDILVDKKYVNEDETTTNRSRLANFLLSKKSFLHEILDLMKNSANNSTLLTGLVDVLCNFLRTFNLPLNEKSIFYNFFTENNLSLIFFLCMNPLAIKQIIPLILTCFENVYSNTNLSEENKTALSYQFFIKQTMDCLKVFDDSLKTTEEGFINSLKITIEPFGIKKLNIVLIVKELCKKNDEAINQELMNTRILKECFELIFKFQWNNMLHCTVEEIFTLCVTNKNQLILKQIFEELDLFEKIMTFCQETTNKFRKGLIAILIDFANSINDNSEEIECFNAYITTNGAKWGDFTAHWLKHVTRQQNIELGTGLFRKARLSSMIPSKELAEKYKEILKSRELLETGDPILGLDGNELADPQMAPEEFDFSPSLPKARTKHLSLYKSKSCMSVEEGMQINVKHHISFTEEYDSFHKELVKNIDQELGISHEKKIIGLRKINSKDFQYIENKDFSSDRLNPEGKIVENEKEEENQIENGNKNKDGL